MNHVATNNNHDFDYEEVAEALADEARDTLRAVVDGELKLSEVSTRYLLDDNWMNDLFVALCHKKYGVKMSLSQFSRLRAVSHLYNTREGDRLV